MSTCLAPHLTTHLSPSLCASQVCGCDEYLLEKFPLSQYKVTADPVASLHLSQFVLHLTYLLPIVHINVTYRTGETVQRELKVSSRIR